MSASMSDDDFRRLQREAIIAERVAHDMWKRWRVYHLGAKQIRRQWHKEKWRRSQK